MALADQAFPPSTPSIGRDAPGASHARWDTTLALLAFGMVDVMLFVGGYRWLHAAVRRWPLIRRRGTTDGGTLIRVCQAVERAAIYYPKPALCLSRSAVTTWLLRWRGIPAQMVIASRPLPFYAHAWVEVGGCVVNDNAKVRERYNEFDRF
jgi:hypothetical protein